MHFNRSESHIFPYKPSLLLCESFRNRQAELFRLTNHTNKDQTESLRAGKLVTHAGEKTILFKHPKKEVQKIWVRFSWRDHRGMPRFPTTPPGRFFWPPPQNFLDFKEGVVDHEYAGRFVFTLTEPILRCCKITCSFTSSSNCVKSLSLRLSDIIYRSFKPS
jgi:hypothetical protein